MDWIFKIVSDYGASLAIILVVAGLFLLTIYYRLKDPFLSILKGDHTKSNGGQANYSPLDTHELFSKVQKLLSVEIPNLELLPKKPVKQQMFRDILSFFVKTIQEECADIAKIDRDDWTAEKWVLEMTKHAQKIVDTFKTKCIDNGVPDIVMVKFFKWNQQTMELLFDHIRTVGKTDVYKSNNERTNTLFLVIGLLIVVTIADAEKTIKELNGEVAGKQYKGQTLEG
jgi:hypothetical protein